MSHNPKEAEKEMKKAIFISADCWLEVFHLLPRSQLGLGIAMISRRFDRRVDEHFKTRKWTLDKLKIRCKIGENGAKQMEIVNSIGKELPIPQNALPSKFLGFGSIEIDFFDHNVLTFLRRFARFFSKCETKFDLSTASIHIPECVVLNIWTLLNDTIRVMYFNTNTFAQMRQLGGPSILFNFPSLRFVGFIGDILPKLPPADDDDDSAANASSDGQAVAKWLFSPRHDNLPKLLLVTIVSASVDQWLATMEQIKAAFSIASSPVAFSICVVFPYSFPFPVVLPFEQTNEFTQEKLRLSKKFVNVFKLIRCSIAAADDEKWMMEIDEVIRGQKNSKIWICIGDDGVNNNGVFDGLPGPSGDQ